MPTITETPSDQRPLRRDAVRNRARILEAAAELFAERGLAATLNDVAHHAGVGVGTVYRHFPDKTELVETLFEARLEEYVAIGEAGLADPDPWRGLTSVMRRTLALQAADRGLHDLLHELPGTDERVGQVRARMLPIGTELIRRAQAAGAIRSDVSPTDLAMTQLMVGAVLDASRDVAPELWQRCLDTVLRGLATDPEAMELDTEPLSPDQVDRVMANYKRRGV